MNYKYIITFFIKSLQKDGLSQCFESKFKNSLSLIKKNSKKEPLVILSQSLNNCKPFCEIKSVRISGSNYKVPIETTIKRQKILICKWILNNASKRSQKNISINLADEIFDTYNFSSKTIKECEDFHKMAEANKMYIRFYK